MVSEEAINEKIEEWRDGEIIAERTFPSGTRIVVTQTDDGRYSMFRAFGLGDRAELSADVHQRTLGDVAAKLLAIVPEQAF